MPLGEVTLSQRWGADPRRITALGTRIAFEMSRAGVLSCLIPLDVVSTIGWPDFKGMEVSYEYPGGPKWAGEITADRRRTGAWEITAETFHVRMKKRRTTRLFRTLTGLPGALAVRLVGDVDNGDPLGYVSITGSGIGDPIRLDDRAMDLYSEALPSLLRNGEYEYDVTWDRRFVFGRQIGTDRRATVHLCEGRHIVDPWSLDGDLWTITNDVLGIPAKRGFAESRAYQVADTASIRQYGRLQGTLVVNDATKHTITPVIKRALRVSKEPLLGLSLTIVNADSCFSRFSLGDTVRVSLGSAGVVVAYRPLAIALDEESGVMSTSGEVVDVIAEAA